jgi:transcriptional antiterminator Rof (Rho-off)
MSIRCWFGSHDYHAEFATREIKCTRCDSHDYLAELTCLRYEEAIRELVTNGEFSPAEAHDEITEYWNDH